MAVNKKNVNNSKKKKLRNFEYYNLQEEFDNLYRQSSEGKIFKNLYDTIISSNNIKLAYRNLKTNKGSHTVGMDNKDIKFLSNLTTDMLIKYVRRRLSNYRPEKVKRVEIPKENGKTRPLGIPTIGDRLIQQCILQVIEPIGEAKFYNHNYGFRPNRSTHNAISRAMTLININKLNYVVDIDIKGFFDNINHGKLLKQMWTLGIRDKRVISIISKMLKAPIEGQGIPSKGTPQGGILSPILSNIVLNELDWWVANQWEYMETKKIFKGTKMKKDGKIIKDNSSKYRELKKTKLKEVFIVRYADDFKIFCRDYKTAFKMYNAVTKWLKERLELDISPEKSKVTNLRKHYTEYLGIKMKAVVKGNKYVVQSTISAKSKEKLIRKFKHGIDNISKYNRITDISNYNASVLGRQNYYRIASLVSKEFAEIDFLVTQYAKCKLAKIRSKSGKTTPLYDKLYGKYKGKKMYIQGMVLFPIYAVRNNPPLNFSQEICNYTESGRKSIHKKLMSNAIRKDIIEYLLKYPNESRTAEFNDNRISLYTGQGGKCSITGKPLTIGDMEVHHKKPTSIGGTDEYKNLTYLLSEIHKLIHLKDNIKINEILNKYKLNSQQIAKVNKLRKLAGNFLI